MSNILVIFDFDGTLVDSEKLCNQAFLDLLPEMTHSTDDLIEKYRGRKLSYIFEDLENEIGRKLPENFECQYRKRVENLFEEKLLPTDGAKDMLERLTYQYCIASSAPREKIVHGLQVSGLASYFPSPEMLFSSYEVGNWKPSPGLFLHACVAMGRKPKQCVVIDDSQIGIEAAIAAEMQWLRYDPNSLTSCVETGLLSKMPDLTDMLMEIELRLNIPCA